MRYIRFEPFNTNLTGTWVLNIGLFLVSCSDITVNVALGPQATDQQN